MKFPKLPNFSKLFRKKGADDESDDEFEDAQDSGDEDGDGAVPAVVDDDVEFGDDEEDEDEEGGRSFARRPMVLAAAGAFVLLAGVAGGAGWWYFDSGDGAAKPSAGIAGKPSKGPMVGLALPPRRGKASGGGGLNQFSGSTKKGVMTPSAPRKSALGTAPSTATNPKSPQPGGSNSLARTVGDIGVRFGGRANPLGGSLNAIGGAAQEEGAGIVIPAVTSVTLRTIPNQKGGKPLGATPDVRLIEKKEGLTGTLPITSKDGEVSWKAYARPFEGEDTGKRVAIVVMGFGLSRASGMAAIGKLPAQVTLALDPYARDLSDWLVRARLVGHEVMMTLPMESERFPVQDAGPYSLDTSLKEEDNIKRLELILSQVSGYFGVATVMGSRFGTSEAQLTPILQALKDRGLMLLTTGVQSSLLAPKIAR
ncbi:MAG: divergent polysaccharide deacetylase family protein, partial [Rhodospirillales bacterium]|nr:divergent polysaccharide deacetylase family protein [Rhodospirillales bacterium]